MNTAQFTTFTSNNQNYSSVQFEEKGVSYSFSISTYDHAIGRISVHTKRKNFSGMGTPANLSEAEFLTKYAKKNAAFLLAEMKRNMAESMSGGKTDNAPAPM